HFMPDVWCETIRVPLSETTAGFTGFLRSEYIIPFMVYSASPCVHIPEEPIMNNATKARFPHSFGVFSPTGYVLMVFADCVSAEHAREALISHGFHDGDVTFYDNNEVQAEFEKNEEHSADPRQIGQDLEKVDRYLEYARKGAGFLAVHAPEEDLAKRAVNLVRPFKLQFAEKYNRLTLEELA
ncbi:MAG TPA: hypothetical protein VGI34_08070, partial [Candidatus Acidoferrales bacterium]